MKTTFFKYATTVPEAGCWLWAGPRTVSGYGVARANASSVRAHRLSWQIHKGPIPTGAVVCHKCDTPLCVNPDHLFLGSQAENVRDRDLKGRASQGAKHSASIAGLVAKLTPEQVVAIRADTRRNVDIAADFGVTKENISSIKRNETWRHV